MGALIKYFAAFTVLVGSGAQAADWWLLSLTGKGKDEEAFFVDSESVFSDRLNTKTAWSYTISERLSATTGIRKSKVLQRFDCDKRTLSILSYVNYGNNDVIINSGTVKSYDQSDDYIIPDTIGAHMWKFLCNGPSKEDFQLKNIKPEEAAVMLFKD